MKPQTKNGVIIVLTLICAYLFFYYPKTSIERWRAELDPVGAIEVYINNKPVGCRGGIKVSEGKWEKFFFSEIMIDKLPEKAEPMMAVGRNITWFEIIKSLLK